MSRDSERAERGHLEAGVGPSARGEGGTADGDLKPTQHGKGAEPGRCAGPERGSQRTPRVSQERQGEGRKKGQDREKTVIESENRTVTRE